MPYNINLREYYTNCMILVFNLVIVLSLALTSPSRKNPPINPYKFPFYELRPLHVLPHEFGTKLSSESDPELALKPW